jgi:hypothetical protein
MLCYHLYSILFIFLLKVLVKELQHSLVTPLILLLHSGILQVSSRSHPAVDLILERLNVLGNLEGLLKLLDLVLGFVARGEQHGGDLDVLGVVGVDHGGVDRGGDGEGVGVGLCGEGDDLAAPAVLETHVSRSRG